MVYVFYWVINSSASGLQKLVLVVETKLYLFQFHLELHLIAHLQQMVLVHMKTLDLQKENMKKSRVLIWYRYGGSARCIAIGI